MATIPQQTPIVPNQSADDELVDTIVYLASLASERQAIEPFLDTIRKLTAEAAPGQAFTPEERQAFLDVEQKIKDYLLNQDPVRAFTEESLQQMLAERKSENAPLLRRWPYLSLLAIWALGLAAAGITLSAPLPASMKPQMAISLFLLGIHIGIAWFFLSGLKHFKAGPRRAYRLIVVGTLITGLGIIQFPLIQAFNLNNASPFFTYGGLVGIFSLAGVFLYAGPRVFAHLIGLKSHLTNLRLITGTALVIVIVAIVTGYLLQRPRIIFFDIRFTAGLLVALFCISGAILAWRISERATKEYRRGLQWYSACLAGLTIGALVNITAFLLTPDPAQTAPLYFLAILMVTDLLLLQAGYAFKKYTTV